VGAGTTYANTAQGLINAINNAGLGLNATFTTAAQAGTAAVSDGLAANGTTAGTGSDTGIEISGTGLGTGTNGARGGGRSFRGGQRDNALVGHLDDCRVRRKEPRHHARAAGKFYR
jgi:hypothetical protein